MKKAGAVAISDDGRPVMNARVMRRAMEFARSFGIPVINHCEDLHLSAGGDMHEGVGIGAPGVARNSGMFGRRDGGARYSAGRSDRRALSRGAYFVAAFGGDGGVRKDPRAGGDGGSDSASSGAGGCGHGALRQQLQDEAAAALALRCRRGGERRVNGAIDAIATDHAPHPGSEKMQEFEKCPFGILGLETALGVALENLVHSGKNRIDAIGGVVHDWTRRGFWDSIAGRSTPARPADVTIFSTDREWTYDVNKSFSKSRNSPFDGTNLSRRAGRDDRGGRVVWRA